MGIIIVRLKNVCLRSKGCIYQLQHNFVAMNLTLLFLIRNNHDIIPHIQTENFVFSTEFNMI